MPLWLVFRPYSFFDFFSSFVDKNPTDIDALNFSQPATPIRQLLSSTLQRYKRYALWFDAAG
jgi:hypothetical protein